MAILVPPQIATYAYHAGIRDQTDLARAVAIAYAESGGNPRAHNPRAPDDSYGLWQINMRGDLGPARRQQFGIASNDQLYDPATNARAMFAISGGGKNWRPWTTYGGARYLLALPAAQAAAAAIRGLAPPVQAAADAAEQLDAMGSIATSVVAAGMWLSDRTNWARIMKVATGVILLAGGAFLITRPAVERAAGAAAKVATVVTKGKTP